MSAAAAAPGPPNERSHQPMVLTVPPHLDLHVPGVPAAVALMETAKCEVAMVATASVPMAAEGSAAPPNKAGHEARKEDDLNPTQLGGGGRG